MKAQKKSSPLLRAFFYLKPHGLLLSAAALAGIFRFAVPLAVPWGVKMIADEVLTKPAGPQSWHLLAVILGSLFCAYLVWTAASYARLYFSGLAGNRMVFDLRADLYKHLQKMPPDFFEKEKIGGVVSRLMNDISAVQQILNQGITAIVMDFLSLFAAAGIMFYMHWKLALVSVAAVPLYAWLSHFFIQKIRASSRRAQEQTEKLSGNLFETFSAVPLTQSFCRESAEEKKFLKHGRAHLEAAVYNVKLQAAGLTLTGFLSGIIPLIIVGYGASLVLSGTLSPGEWVAFYAYVGLLYLPITRLTEMNMMIGGGLAALDRIFEILDTEPRIQDTPSSFAPASFRSEICFQNVSFSYPDGSRVFKEMNFTVRPEECVALTGVSGSGKSTLVKLLLRFCDPLEGTVWVGGHDARGLKLDFLRSQIAWVPQEPVLFSGSVLDNILYGRPGASAREVVQAAQAANAHDFISALPRRYETQVGEKGTLLSAGEKQRIALARAFLKNAPILVLDEPSSALDENSESLILESFKEIRKGKTVLMISHRPSMLEDAGRALCLKNGAVLEWSGALPESGRP